MGKKSSTCSLRHWFLREIKQSRVLSIFFFISPRHKYRLSLKLLHFIRDGYWKSLFETILSETVSPISNHLFFFYFGREKNKETKKEEKKYSGKIKRQLYENTNSIKFILMEDCNCGANGEGKADDEEKQLLRL